MPSASASRTYKAACTAEHICKRGSSCRWRRTASAAALASAVVAAPTERPPPVCLLELAGTGAAHVVAAAAPPDGLALCACAAVLSAPDHQAGGRLQTRAHGMPLIKTSTCRHTTRKRRLDVRAAAGDRTGLVGVPAAWECRGAGQSGGGEQGQRYERHAQRRGQRAHSDDTCGPGHRQCVAGASFGVAVRVRHGELLGHQWARWREHVPHAQLHAQARAALGDVSRVLRRRRSGVHLAQAAQHARRFEVRKSPRQCRLAQVRDS